jgi:hypothetical protein
MATSDRTPEAEWCCARSDTLGMIWPASDCNSSEAEMGVHMCEKPIESTAKDMRRVGGPTRVNRGESLKTPRITYAEYWLHVGRD